MTIHATSAVQPSSLFSPLDIEIEENKQADATAEVDATEATSSANGEQTYQTPLVLLGLFFLAMALYQISMAKSDSQASQLQNQGGDVIVKQSQDSLKDARLQLAKTLEAIKEYEDECAKSKVLNIVMSVLGCIAAALSGGTLATVLAVAMTIFMNCGGAEKLNQLTGSGTAEAFGLKLALCIGMAVVLGGAAAGLSSAAEGAGLAGANQAADQAADQGAEEAAKDSTSSFFSSARSNASDIFAQTSLTINPFTDLVTAIAKSAGASDETKALLGQILGIILALVVAAACKGTFSSEEQGGLGNTGKISAALEGKLGKAGFQAFKKVALRLQNILDLSTIGVKGAAAGYTIKQGLSLLDQADLQKQTGHTFALLTYFDELDNQQGALIQRQVGHYDSLMSSFQATNQTMDQLIAPYIVAGQIQA